MTSSSKTTNEISSLDLEDNNALFVVHIPNSLKIREIVFDSIKAVNDDANISDSNNRGLWEEELDDRLDLVVVYWNNTHSPFSSDAIEFLEPSYDLMSVIRNLMKYSFSNIEELFWAMPMHLASNIEHRDFNRHATW